MGRLLKVCLMVVVCVVLAAAVFLFLQSRSGPGFERIDLDDFSIDKERFRIDARLQKIYFKKGDQETWLEELPCIHGYPFYLRGKRSIRIRPPLSGEVGFYTYLHLDNLGRKQGIRFSLELLRAGKTQELGRVHAGSRSRPFFKELTLKRSDRLVLKFQGSGVVFFSRPIIYRIKRAGERKNIFLIGVDTLRADQVGTRVNGQPLTPHIDAFKKECVVFENAYAQSPWTLPSFISLFTGLYEFNHRVDIRRPLEATLPSLMEKFSEKFVCFGYHSGMVMKKRWGYSRGFDYYKQVPLTNTLFPKAGQTLFREALMLLEKAKFSDFFFFLHTYQVHDPYTPPREYLYRINANPRYKRLDAVNQRAPWKSFLPVEDELRRSLKELYQAEIHAFDAYFGAFVRKLKELGLYDNAVIIFMSDHGEEFFEHGGWAHAHGLYDELIRVPLMIKFPANEYENSRFFEPVGVIDILPTLLNRFGIACDEAGIDGLDLMPLIRGEGDGYKREYLVSSIAESRYIEQIPAKFAILYKEYKIIYNDAFSSRDLEFFKNWGLPPQPGRIEVYDLKADPQERHNIAEKKPDVVKSVQPIILKIRKILQQNLRQKGKSGSLLDDEAKKQLESLGYI